MALQNIDKSLFLNINRYAKRTPGLHGFMLFLANEGIVIFMLLLVAAYFLVRFVPRWKTRQNMTKVATTGVATVIAIGANQPIAHLVKEPRPYNSLSHILVLIHRANDYSFPSDHGVMIGAVTTGLFLIDPLLGVIALVIGLLVAFARVYTAAHYPHDLIGGILVGAVILLICYVLLKKPMQMFLRWLEKTPLRIFIDSNKIAVASKE